MRERNDGRVVVIGSTACIHGDAHTSAYSASKHAVLGLVRSAAAEVAATGVTVNAVCPTYVDTPMTAASIARISEATGRGATDVRSRLERTTGLGRLLSAAEVAAAVLYLVAPTSGGINGHALVLDGGS
jgi:NAD(P)-dependent dehydrogenase (short-subunit alcohol dehydrogenase family)